MSCQDESPGARKCANERCTKVFTGPKKYCSPRCRMRQNCRNYARKKRGVGSACPRSEFVEALRREVGPGRCLFCPREVSRREAVTCGQRECLRKYNTTWRSEERRRLRGEPSLYAREPEDEELAGEFRAEMGEMMRRTSLLLEEWCARVDELVADLGLPPRTGEMEGRG
ncbi:hypothetical protein D7X74_24490 [Corallococcus sp. CA047B]|uniref:hypothetical protein n=1 Tax=Corallococcus sp. CA047B TaxID=2316729 RepID=UPI000EA1AFA4|nr:hypothetical protein [Corallococcus sp. CA047B]RKH11982.1 hypothetical protein D7X74_24490 [Corallococcus sp. CA047B]